MAPLQVREAAAPAGRERAGGRVASDTHHHHQTIQYRQPIIHKAAAEGPSSSVCVPSNLCFCFFSKLPTKWLRERGREEWSVDHEWLADF